MSPGYWIDRNFLVKFVEELHGRGSVVEKSLFSMPRDVLRLFAIFAEIPDGLIVQFVQSNDCDRVDPKMFDNPTTLGLEIRRILVLALLDKANLGNAKRDITAFNPTRRWQDRRDFVSIYVEQTRKRGMNVLEFLFTHSSKTLEGFALLVELPHPLINRFVESADPMERPQGDLIYAPDCKRLRDRRDLVLAIVEKVGR